MDGTLYNILLVLHIVAVTLWLGSNLAMGLGSGRAVGASDEVNAWWADTQGFLGRTLKNAAYAVLLLTGIGMVLASDEAIKFSAPFVSVGFLVVIIGGALGGMIFAPGTRKIAEQCRQRLTGTTTHGATRIVSLHDPDARPIVKGRLGRPVEFGYKAQIVDNEDGIIVDHNIEQGNPPDAPQLVPAIQRVKQRTGRAPRSVTADRGYGDAGVEDELRGLGVRYPAIPTKGKPGAARRQVEQRRAFRKLVRWRTGSEGRINCAKRDFGLARTRYIGIDGARTWCGHGVFNHNLVKIAALTDTN